MENEEKYQENITLIEKTKPVSLQMISLSE